MVLPLVPTGIEQVRKRARVGIERGDITAFATVALKTGVGEIAQRGVATVLLSNDVVHFMAVKIDARIIRLLTIFAPPLRALDDTQAHLAWNIGRHYEDACKLRNA
jgi:hypothetical protein